MVDQEKVEAAIKLLLEGFLLLLFQPGPAEEPLILMLALPSVLCLAVTMNTFYQMEPDRYVSHKLYRDVAGEHNEQAVKEALKNDGGYYRTEQMGNDDENAADLNRIWDAGQNITSIYSSAYNSEYQTFRQKSIKRAPQVTGYHWIPCFLVKVSYIV